VTLLTTRKLARSHNRVIACGGKVPSHVLLTHIPQYVIPISSVPKDNNMTYDPPLNLSIPLPCSIPRARGLHSTGGFGGNLRVRCTDDEKLLVQSEAHKLGLTLSSFSRWCIIHAAQSLKEHRNVTTGNIGVRQQIHGTQTR